MNGRISTAAKLAALTAACLFVWVLLAMNAWGART
jgi:hypothetical protein